jgi:hypothetical protein
MLGTWYVLITKLTNAYTKVGETYLILRGAFQLSVGTRSMVQNHLTDNYKVPINCNI